MVTKKCTICSKVKPLIFEYFYRDKSRKSGFRNECRSCSSIRAKKWYNTEKGRAARKKQYERRKKTGKHYLSVLKAALKRDYNMTISEYCALLESQNQVCGICGGVNSDGRRLFIDHDHKTGKVRGLLCHQCNIMLGHAKDNLSVLRSAVGYLEKLGERE